MTTEEMLPEAPMSLDSWIKFGRSVGATHLFVVIDGRDVDLPSKFYLPDEVELVMPGSYKDYIEQLCNIGGHIIHSIDLIEHSQLESLA